jgi:hypothetical protein
VFQEVKWYLTSLPIMVALEPGSPLLLYIAATAEVVSMVLVMERPEQRQPQALNGTPTTDFGSQDPDPVGGPRDEASGSQIPEPTLSPKPQIGPLEVPSGPEGQEASESQIMKPTLGLDNQHVTESQLPEVPLGPRGQEPSAPEPMDIDLPDPP